MADTPKVGMIGDGRVGSALTRGLERAGYEVQSVGNEPQQVSEIARWADVVFLAVPFAAREDALREMDGNHRGKTLVDVTNALDQNRALPIDPRRESGAEELQSKAPGAKVVKAFNTVFAQHMDSGRVRGERVTIFIAGNDEAAKWTVSQMAAAIGFEAVDTGALEYARWLEALGYLNIALAYRTGLGPDIGFRLVREQQGIGQRAA